MSSGIAAGVTAAPVYDEQKRPITAGGFVDTGTVVFQDITKAAGLSGWTHKMGVPQKNFIVETNGSGVCLIDYDNDGWLDIYLVNGATFDSLDGKEEPPHAALFHNNHDGTFTDVTKDCRSGRTTAGAMDAPWLITTMMAGRISMSATTARIGFTTTTMTERLRMKQRRPACGLGKLVSRIDVGRLRRRRTA